MARVEWQNEYKTGISLIDDQHKKLFSLIVNFYQNIKEQKNREALLKILEELTKYAVYHFNTEEALLKQYNFIGIKKHIKEHDVFKNEVTTFINKVKSGKMVLSLEVTRFLNTWIVNHILKTDMEYSGFLISRGVQ